MGSRALIHIITHREGEIVRERDTIYICRYNIDVDTICKYICIYIYVYTYACTQGHALRGRYNVAVVAIYKDATAFFRQLTGISGQDVVAIAKRERER